jgi:hypothetical protein
MQRLTFLASLYVLFAACAEGGGGEAGDGGPPRTDGSPPADAGQVDAGRLDGGRRDAGSTSCPAGQHACGGGCVDDLPNDPANGCRLGCGEPCPTPSHGTASCTAGGTCDFTCTAPFRRVEDRCECAPRTCADVGAMCGAPDDGCGRALDCGTCPGGRACVEGRCACAPDGREPNDNHTIATMYPGALDDSRDPPDVVYDDMTIHQATDVDWIRFEVVDGTDFGNPQITVTLDRVPSGATFELSAFYVCAAGRDATTCSSGIADAEVGSGCRTSGTGTMTITLATDCEHFSTDDSGALLVRVRATTWSASCDAYRLTVRVR